MNAPEQFKARHIISTCTPGPEASAEAMRHGHKHEHREMLYVVEGTSMYMFNARMFQATPGCVFLVDPWCSHTTGYMKEDHDLFHLWLHQDAPAGIVVSPMRIVQGGQYSLRTPSFRLPPEYAQLLVKRWNLASQALDSGDQETVERLMREPVNALLDEIALHLQTANADGERAVSSSDAVIENLRKYIRTNNGRACGLEMLEKLSGYNRFYLSHRFKLATGKTIGSFISDVRLAYTEAALQRGLRQKEIATDLGFSSPSNFWNWYQKHKT